jgi:hypothetical protein
MKRHPLQVKKARLSKHLERFRMQNRQPLLREALWGITERSRRKVKG